MDGLEKLIESIREKIASHEFGVAGHNTASFGLSAYQPDDNVESIMTRADKALYQAKHNGRNRLEIGKE